jgi:hypothetical protein
MTDAAYKSGADHQGISLEHPSLIHAIRNRAIYQHCCWLDAYCHQPKKPSLNLVVPANLLSA